MRWQGVVGGGFKGPLVELVLENVVHSFIGLDPGAVGPLASGLQALWGVAFGQAEDTQAGAVSLLRVPAGIERPADEFAGLLADFSGPAQKALRRPLAVELVLGRHVHAVG